MIQVMEEKSTKKSGYGKRPLWQWLVIYLVIGGIVYAAIYYFVFAKNGGYNYSTGQYQQQNTPYNYNK